MKNGYPGLDGFKKYLKQNLFLKFLYMNANIGTYISENLGKYTKKKEWDALPVYAIRMEHSASEIWFSERGLGKASVLRLPDQAFWQVCRKESKSPDTQLASAMAILPS